MSAVNEKFAYIFWRSPASPAGEQTLMLELFTEAIRPINLPLTVFVVVITLYWLLVGLGLLGLDFGADADLDADSGAGDIDLDGSANSDGGHADAGWLSSVLGFLNIGEVPITIVISVLGLFAWMLSILVNYYWTSGSLILGLIALIPIILVSAFLTRYITMPFRPLLRALSKEGEEHAPLIGRTCQITTSEANPRFGQAEIARKGAPVLIDVRTTDNDVLPRGSTGLIVRRDDDKGIYYVVPISSDRLE